MTPPLPMRLRILNGTHAGAVVDLQEGEQVIGREPENDISISDWAGAPICLHCSADGVVTQRSASPAVTSEALQADAKAMTAFQPASFGDIVLCVGPAQGQWPSDMQLLALVFKPSHNPRGKLATVGIFAAVLLAVVGGYTSLSLLPSSAKASSVPFSLERAAIELRDQFARAGLNELNAHATKTGIEISGLIDSQEEARVLRTILAGLPDSVVVLPRYAVVQTLAETLRTTIGIAGAQVRHLGAGSFVVEAEVADHAAASAAIDRVVADLAPHVRHVLFPDSGKGQRLNGQPVTAAYSDGQSSIVQTRDGRIHLMVSSFNRNATEEIRTSPLPQTN